jgi:hypothetical protein
MTLKLRALAVLAIFMVAEVLALSACAPPQTSGPTQPRTPTSAPATPSVSATSSLTATSPAESSTAAPQTTPSSTPKPPKPHRPTPPTMLPAIVVTLPHPGDTVGRPARVVGTADVFEAQFRVSVVDKQHMTIADVPVKATSRTGTRGTFDAMIPYPSGHAGRGTLVFFEPSAKNGSPINVVEVPVMLR